MHFTKSLVLTVLVSLVIAFGVTLGQDDESPVLLTLNPAAAEKEEAKPVITVLEPRPLTRQIGSSGGGSPNPFGDTIRNLNITGRLGNIRSRIGRFRLPKVETNEKSLSYRTGRRIGLILQGIAKRARAFAERLRARANTATPTIS